jgi:GTPase KRas protein
MNEMFMREGDGFLFVFPVTSRSAFEKAKSQYETVLRHKEGYSKTEDYVPAILVALVDETILEREVSCQEALEFARSRDMIYTETSKRRIRDIGPEPLSHIVRVLRCAEFLVPCSCWAL